MLFKCKECGEEFATRKSLHSHFKKHNMLVGDYYVKHFPRKDRLTGEQIPFKNIHQYFSQDFRDYDNMEKWLSQVNLNTKSQYIKTKLQNLKEKKIKTIAPCVFELRMRDLPDEGSIAEVYGSYKEMCEELGWRMMFPGVPDMKCMERDWSDVGIIVDTREQKPLRFKNTVRKKLDIGDYGLAEGGNTFVERKSAADYKSTLTMGFDRFEREVGRAVANGQFLWILVESSLAKMEEENVYSPYVVNMKYLYHNTKTIQRKYFESCQFVFTGSRKNSEFLIPKLLGCGESMWDVDMQHFLRYICGS